MYRSHLPKRIQQSSEPLPLEAVPSNKQLLKRGYMEMLRESKVRYFLTLTLMFSTTSMRAQNSLDQLVVNLNENIYKQRYFDKKNFLKGFVAREYTDQMKSDHFHILLNENEEYNLPAHGKMIKKIQKEVNNINRHSKLGKISSIDLQEYFNNGDDALEKYFLKMFDGFQNQDTCNDSIGILDHNGVLFGS